MRNILFQHIPSGADLMTRDLKMYMLEKEGLKGVVRGGGGYGEEEKEKAGRK